MGGCNVFGFLKPFVWERKKIGGKGLCSFVVCYYYSSFVCLLFFFVIG